MHEQAKIQRVLKLIRLLLQAKYNIHSLELLLECSKSTVYKYIQLLEEVGYNIDKTDSGQYFIYAPNFITHQFSAKEINYLQNIITAVPKTTITLSILKKINLDPVVPSAEYLAGVETLEYITIIQECISNKKWLNFERYTSSNTNKTSDRIVFPIELLPQGQILAYERAERRIKTFKINRIGHVSLNYDDLEVPDFTNNDDHDLFGMTGKDDIIVKLLLTEQARNLLLEEYPLAANMTQSYVEGAFHHVFNISVRNFAGIGRFILGLPGEIKVVSPTALIQYLNERNKKSTFLDN